MFRSTFILMIFVIIQVQDALGQFGTPLLVRSADVVLHDHPVHEGDPHARLAALDHFLGTYVHHHHGLDIVQQARVDPSGCSASDKFKACCTQIGMTSPVTNIPNLIDNGCKYPPDELNTMERITLGSYFNEYVMCYADGRSNRDCCALADVPAEKKYGVWKVNCQHLCIGHPQTLSANPGWKKCTPFKPQIAKCNEDGTEFDDTAAMRNGFCKNPSWCQSPMQWKTMCRPKVMAHTYLGR